MHSCTRAYPDIPAGYTRSAPAASAHAVAAAVRSAAAHTDYAKMECRFFGTADKKMWSDTKMAGLTVVAHEQRYLGMTSHAPGLEAIIIADFERDLSLVSSGRGFRTVAHRSGP